MSKFDYDTFCGGYDDLAVSKEKYNKTKAIEIAKSELEHRKHKYLFVGDGFVRHRAGINEVMNLALDGGWNTGNISEAVPAGCFIQEIVLTQITTMDMRLSN